MARVTVLGRSGTGKSYYTGYLLEQTVPEFDYAVHFDIEDEEIGLSDADHDPLYKTLRVDQETAANISWVKAIANHEKLRVVPEGLTTEEQREVYAQIAEASLALVKEHVPDATAFISCDEAHNIVRQSAFDDRVERMITGGRKHGLECLHISQRPQLLHTTVISQADRRVYFGISDDNDLGKIDKVSNFPASDLKSLASRVCIVENKDSGEYEQISTDGIGRQRPHYSGDDGIVDDKLPV
ncbi:terminase large subunit [Haloarcula hispanica icosahedral virus 2]|uniref:Putative ATPase n=1 Tax=Haloarcula hispanica icosahedral virus 2 TaxID=1154689 RepID=H9AZW3_9VIRU|nr:terminase large subunit [Haloarcula hispanica icosahedral virus 2]AFD02288.1 putative ATPase [Haloarcula hispanica icosahedral virus 2]